MNSPYGPLDKDPRGLRPPYTERDPQREQRICEPVDVWRARMHADCLAALLDPLDGIELGIHDRLILDWLAGWGSPTVATIASLLHRARHARPLADGSVA